MTKYLLYTLLVILGMSCKNQTQSDKDAIYFGGEVINPSSNYITLKKGEKLIDTLFLDKENKFIEKYTNLDEGLYTFYHGSELQYVFFEKSDSIMVNLNTLDFDESLVYSGNGADKNEYLTNLFLENEKDDYFFRTHYNLSSEEFKDKVILLKELREVKLEEFLLEHPETSNAYINIAKTAINYPLYKRMEYYPLAHKKITKSKSFPKLNKDFYDYREDTNLNDSTLIGYYAYTDYIINFLYNQSFCNLKAKNDSTCSVRLCFFKSVDENIQLKSFKNKLLMGNIIHNLIQDNKDDLDVLNMFLKISTNKNDIKNVKRLISDKESLKKKQVLEDFEIISGDGTKTSLFKVANNKKTILYFWSDRYVKPEYLSTRIQYLSKKHPDISFIGIHTNKENTIHDTTLNHYFLTNSSAGHKYNTSGFPRTILLSEDGVVINSYTNITDNKFTSHLKAFQNN
ncbi:TlpA family protein disulfide reductase [Bacteroidota bacterium]